MPVPTSPEILIDREPELRSACAAVAADGVVAIDTEFMRTSQYTPQLCIVQVASGSQVFCVDELAEMSTGPLWDVLCHETGTRVLHAAKQDLEVIWLRTQRLPAVLFDTQIAAAMLGHPAQIGYAPLIKALFDVEVDKTHTRADWSRRPLAPELIRYAAIDVVHLPATHDRLGEELERRGRLAWAAEDCARLLDPALYTPNPDDAWRRLTAIPRLPVPAQLRARRLARWREDYAIRADRPRQWILSDRTLLDAALRGPETTEELAACEDVAAGLVRRHGDTILHELREAAREFAEGTDLVQEPRAEPLDQENVKRLSRVVDQHARELGIPAEILATRRDLTALLRGESGIRPLTGWRRDVIGDALLAALGGAA